MGAVCFSILTFMHTLIDGTDHTMMRDQTLPYLLATNGKTIKRKTKCVCCHNNNAKLKPMGGRRQRHERHETHNKHTLSVIFDKRQNEKSMTFIKGNL